MTDASLLHLIFTTGLFVVGTVVGSFLNVCIYRIPWQKSVVWPGSRCPRCRRAIAARDNIPIVSWLLLRGACRWCGAPISPRYPVIEALVGLLFVGVYLSDVLYGPRTLFGEIPVWVLGRLFYHLILVALLVAATFIDYDLWIIPDEVTVPGMVLGVGLGALMPWVRPEPGTAETVWGGLGVGLLGLLVGGGLVATVRFVASHAFRREAMGFGDVTLVAMIGSFLGWQVAVLAFFLSAFFGLGHALLKLVLLVMKWASGLKIVGSDRELPFGPYLSMAAVTLLLGWPWIWDGWAKELFETLSVVFWYVVS